MEEKEIKLHLKACDICALLLRDIKYISIPLMEKGVEDKIRYITMLELKCYYWLLDAFINEVMTSLRHWKRCVQDMSMLKLARIPCPRLLEASSMARAMRML